MNLLRGTKVSAQVRPLLANVMVRPTLIFIDDINANSGRRLEIAVPTVSIQYSKPSKAGPNPETGFGPFTMFLARASTIS